MAQLRMQVRVVVTFTGIFMVGGMRGCSDVYYYKLCVLVLLLRLAVAVYLSVVLQLLLSILLAASNMNTGKGCH